MSVHLVDHRLVPSLMEKAAANGWALQQSGEPDANGMTSIIFTPDLSPAGTETLSDLLASMRAGIVGLKAADVQMLAAYLDTVSPTGVQTVAAVNALIRVLRAVVRDV